jgi:hypothetical protein
MYTINNIGGCESSTSSGGTETPDPSGLGGLMGKLRGDTGDAGILICGDSTGNEDTEWAYYLAQWYFSNFSEFTVNYYLWDSGAVAYSPAVLIGSGSGANTLNIYNISVSGWRPDVILGEGFADGVEALSGIDAIFINHGHNTVTTYNNTDQEYIRVPQYLELISPVVRVHSNAGLVIIGQNPRRDDTSYDDVFSSLSATAEVVGAEFINVHEEFVSRGKAPSLYFDGTHPSKGLTETGTQLFYNKIIAAHGLASPVADAKLPTNSLADTATSGENLLVNGDMSDYAVTLGGWSLVNCTTSKEVVNFENTINNYSVLLTPVSSTSISYIQQNITGSELDAIKGKWITMFVRYYIPAGTNPFVGRLTLKDDVATGNTIGISNDARDNWFWRGVSLFVDPSTTSVNARIWCDSSTSNGETCLVDRAVCVEGRLPRDII